MNDVTFIFHSEWLESIRGLPADVQDKIIAEIVRYGAEMEMQHGDDAVVQACVNLVKGRIDFSKDKYAEKSDLGKKGKKADPAQIWMMAQSGMKSSEIAEALGVSKSSVDHSEGWRRRNEGDFAEKFLQ